jgi:hypothetical protein
VNVQNAVAKNGCGSEEKRKVNGESRREEEKMVEKRTVIH